MAGEGAIHLLRHPIRAAVAAVLLSLAGAPSARAQEPAIYTDIYVAVAPATATEGAEIARRLSWMFIDQPAAPSSGMGGVRLLYDIGLDDYLATGLAAQRDAMRIALGSEPAVPYERLGVAGNAVEVTIGGAVPATEAQLQDVRARLERLRGPLPEGGFAFDLDMSGGFVRFTYSEAGLAYRTAELRDATVTAIGRRIATLDVDAIARWQGDDRIVLTLAGLDIDEAQAAIARSDGLLGLRLVTETLLTPVPDPVPSGLRAVPDATDPGIVYLMEDSPVVGIDGFASARAEIDAASRLPVVRFDLTPDAARVFATVTAANVGRTLAIVVGGVVVSAPVIQTAILGGTGVVTGNFDWAEARNLAEAIRAGGLPAPVTLAETRTVDDAWPVGSPTLNGGALAVELMSENGAVVLPWEIASAAYWLGLGKGGVQRLDGNDQIAVLTIPLPRDGAAGRALALERLRKQLEGLYSIRAVWELGPLLVLEPDIGFVPLP